MSEDRRTTRRVRLPGVQVTYESATGQQEEARVVDLSREGLYIPCATPLPVGKRLSLEIQPIGEPVVWSALGRVVWVRNEDDGVENPAGMAVKIIDADDEVRAAIERLLEAREPTERGLGSGDTVLPLRPRARSNPPARERTMLGVGAEEAAAPTAPILITTPGREPTLVGVGLATEPAENEASLAIDLVAKKAPSAPPPPEVVEPQRVIPRQISEDVEPVEPVEPVEDDQEPLERLPKTRSGLVFVLFLLLMAAGVSAYFYRDRIPAISHVVHTWVDRLR